MYMFRRAFPKLNEHHRHVRFAYETGRSIGPGGTGFSAHMTDSI